MKKTLYLIFVALLTLIFNATLVDAKNVNIDNFDKFLIIKSANENNSSGILDTLTTNSNDSTATDSQINNNSQVCDSLLGNPTTPGTPAFYLVVAFRVIKYVAIIILIVFSILDFISAIASSDNDSIIKATQKVIKRFILCIAIFLLPELLEFILKYISIHQTELCSIS